MLRDDFASVKDLAQTYSVTMEHASRRFRQRYLMTPSTLRSERRFRHALTLLQRTKHSLSEIAHMAGYSDQPHFSRSCQRITGFSPGKLRGRSC
jgi:transcriptional regulator GlxA family with amidase domain